MRRLKIFQKDIKEAFVRSSGSGGQNVNKVSTCVQLMHVPTGIQVKCQAERSQAANRYLAKHMLMEKIERFFHEKSLKEARDLACKKRQDRRKPAGLKEIILQEKHKQSDKKQSRRKIRTLDAD